MNKPFFYIFLLLLLVSTTVTPQDRNTTCGRFGLKVGNTGHLSEYNWPRDFRYAKNGGGATYDILIENWSKPDGNLNGYAVPGDISIGSVMTISNKKYVKYPYPVIFIEDNEITDTDIYDEVDENLPCDQMIETLATTYVGVSLRQRVYSWSHPKYQDFAIVHLQFINTGNIDANPATVELPDNRFSQFYFFEVNTFKPGLGSHDEQCDRDHEKGDRADVYSSTEVWTFEGDDPNNPGVLDPLRPQLLHVSVGRDPNDTWFGQPVDNEGDPKPETGEFMSPMYVGEGIIHIDKNATDHAHDISKLKMLRWDTHYWLYHGETAAREDRYNVYRYGYHDEFFVPDQEHDAADIFTGGQRSLTTFGPFEGFAFGDTLNLVFFRGVTGINSKLALEKGAEWLDWWQNGNGDFDDQAKNELLRTGEDSLLQAFERAKIVWENGLQLPEGLNPQPPRYLRIVNTDSNHLQLTWLPPLNADDVIEYNVYYAIGSRDARYELLDVVPASGTSLDSIYYTCRDPKPGFAHYFNVTAVNAEGYESSLYMCRTNRLAIYPGLAQGITMDDVRIVPNPFVYDRDAIANYTGEPDKIMVAGLPPGRTEIRLFTLTGDLVRELVHDAATGGNDGLDFSNLKKGRRYLTISDNNQYIASGVYIYHVKSLDGYGEKTGKFIVVR